jgi:hypothetical protein
MELFGKPLEHKEGKTTESDGVVRTTPDVFSMTRKNCEEVFAEQGATREVFDVIENAHAVVVGKAAVELANHVVETGRAAMVKLPTKLMTFEATVHPVKEKSGIAPARDGGEGTPYKSKSYGDVDLRVRMAMPKSLREEVLPGIASQMEAAFADK